VNVKKSSRLTTSLRRSALHFDIGYSYIIIDYNIKHSMLIYICVCIGCQCVVYESNGGTRGTITSPAIDVDTPPLDTPAHLMTSRIVESYPADLSCLLYTFIGDLDEIVEITFTEFDVQPANPASGSVVNL